MDDQIFVAEVKTQDPWGWRSERTWDELLDLAIEHGDWVSLHVEPEWGGSLELLRKGVERAHAGGKWVLAKGMHTTDDAVQRSLNQGADRVLTVGRVVGDKDHTWTETATLGSLDYIAEDRIVIWNQRGTLYRTDDGEIAVSKPKLSFEHARNKFSGVLFQASLIEQPADVHPGADGFIVGKHLPEFVTRL